MFSIPWAYFHIDSIAFDQIGLFEHVFILELVRTVYVGKVKLSLYDNACYSELNEILNIWSTMITFTNYTIVDISHFLANLRSLIHLHSRKWRCASLWFAASLGNIYGESLLYCSRHICPICNQFSFNQILICKIKHNIDNVFPLKII